MVIRKRLISAYHSKPFANSAFMTKFQEKSNVFCRKAQNGHLTCHFVNPEWI